MVPEQVSLIAEWISAIDPVSHIDQYGFTNDMEGEWCEAKKEGISQYHIGYYLELSVFFMVGVFYRERSPVSRALEDGAFDYEIATLLPSPLVTHKNLHFPLYYEAVKFTFQDERVGRVIHQVEVKNVFVQSILHSLGFNGLGFADLTCTRAWWGCRRDEFREH